MHTHHLSVSSQCEAHTHPLILPSLPSPPPPSPHVLDLSERITCGREGDACAISDEQMRALVERHAAVVDQVHREERERERERVEKEGQVVVRGGAGLTHFEVKLCSAAVPCL